MESTKHLVAVLPDGRELFEEIRPFAHRGFCDSDYRHACEIAVRKSGLTTPRNNPVPIRVELFSLVICDGKLERRMVKAYDITPPLQRMTAEQYAIEMQELLGEIPEEFRPYVEGESYDRGHSAGYEECVSIGRSMVSALKPCIEKFESRISNLVSPRLSF